MDEYTGPERRAAGHCEHHNSNMAQIQEVSTSMNKITGGLALMKIVVGIATVMIGGSLGVLLNKVTTIETLLIDNKTAIAIITTRVDGIDKRVIDIERRHDFLDQNGVIKRVR